MENFVPPKPANSYRIVLDLHQPQKRLDTILLQEFKIQNDDLKLKEVSRSKLKELFSEGKILIKGQRANPSSSLAKGITYVDILGFGK
jgi:hypothetical protein